MNHRFFAAFLLLGMGIAFPVSKVSAVEPKSVVPVASIIILAEDISQQTLTLLIEQHAVANWTLTVANAWNFYGDGTLVVNQVGKGRFELRFTGEVLTVLLDDGF